MNGKFIAFLSLIVALQSARAAQSVFSVFPNVGGDLASQADWGDVPLPTSADHVQISKSATYKLSGDLSIASVSLTAKDVVFDFTDGNHTLTLHTMCSGWGNVTSLFQYDHSDRKPTVTLKGGVWKSASSDNNFWIVPLGNTDAPNSSSHLFMVTNGCVITNVGGFHTSRRYSNSRTIVADGSRLYGKTMSLFEVSGTNNVLEIASGGQVWLSTAFHGDSVHDTGKWSQVPLDNMVDIHGAGSMLKVTGGDGSFVGRYSSGMGMRVRDGGRLETTGLFLGRCASTSISSNNWIEVTDGGCVTANTFQAYGPHNTVLISNATFRIANVNDTTYTMGAGGNQGYDNKTIVSGKNAVFAVKPGTDGDVFGRYGRNNTFVMENGAVWAPHSQTFFFWSSNNVFRLTGKGTLYDNATNSTDGTYYYTRIGPSDRNYDSWVSNTWNNVIEILDGAEFRANRLFVHGWNNTIVVSNATLTAGDGTSYGIWLGRQASSNCTLTIKGTTPKVLSTYPNDRNCSFMLQSASRLRYEIPREGYAAGYAAIEMGYLSPVSANSVLEIECSEWAARSDRDNLELVLFHGVRDLGTNGGAADWLASQNLNLPENVTCFIRGKDLILKRKVAGLCFTVR